ncbi:SMC-Scp complex subunit ScpB, partial [Chlamydiales bacterium]|nr:SMC-Scp complex subunit ScpB [Chlamydiales bacterium]
CIKTRSKFFPYISQLHSKQRSHKISQAQTEVLAIIAYQQPITRAEVDKIRGVDSSSMIQVLLERELICSLGQKEVVGRPILYGTGENFLIHFGLKSLEDLSPIR